MIEGSEEYKRRFNENWRKNDYYKWGVGLFIIGAVSSITGIGITWGIPLILLGVYFILFRARQVAIKLTKSQFNIKITPKKKTNENRN